MPYFKIVFSPAFYEVTDHSPPLLQPMPLLQPGGVCKQNQKGTGKEKMELDCTEKSPNVYNIRLNVPADKRFSQGLAFLYAKRKYGWTIWQKDIFLPPVEGM